MRFRSDLLPVRRVLSKSKLSEKRIGRYPVKQSTAGTHWDLLHLEDVRVQWYVSPAQRCVDGGGNCVLEWWVQLMHRAHLDEQQHTLTFALWPSLINAYHVVDA